MSEEADMQLTAFRYYLEVQDGGKLELNLPLPKGRRVSVLVLGERGEDCDRRAERFARLRQAAGNDLSEQETLELAEEACRRAYEQGDVKRRFQLQAISGGAKPPEPVQARIAQPNCVSTDVIYPYCQIQTLKLRNGLDRIQ